jgi:NAD-dependent SIR2 family protein deacetylase
VSRTVFIVGAGASAESGGPVMATFLDYAYNLRRNANAKLSKRQQDSLDLVFKGISALQVAHSKSDLDLNNLESVFGAFEMARLAGRLPPLSKEEVEELNPAMRLLIVTALEKSIRFPVVNRAQVRAPHPYHDFGEVLISRIAGSDLGPISFITFNYDLALDYLLHFRREQVDYCFNDEPQGGVPLMKLHGSVNWARCTSCQKTAPWSLNDFFMKHDWNRAFWDDKTREVEFNVGALLKQYEHCSGQACEPDPVIVPPTWNKSEYPQVANVWKHAARHLADAENIIVIGYSLPDADQFFRYLFAVGTIGDARPQRFWVIDPDNSGRIETRFQNLLGPYFESRFQKFTNRSPTASSE